MRVAAARSGVYHAENQIVLGTSIPLCSFSVAIILSVQSAN
jgi:hypothetical protein